MQEESTSESTQVENDRRNLTFTYRIPKPLNGYFVNQDRNPSSANLTAMTFSMYNDSGTDGFLNVPRYLSVNVEPEGGIDTDRTPSGFALYAFIRISTSSSDPGSVLSANLCSFSFCVHRRNVSMTAGKFNSSIVDTFYADRKASIRQGSNTTYTFLDGEGSFSLHLGPAPEPAIETALDTLSTGNVTESTASQPLDDNSTASSNLIYGLDASHDIPMTMQNVVVAMTNAIRDPSNHTIGGQVGTGERYIHIAWPWIVLPAFLVVSGTAFLILAMIETRRRRACIWKESELAPLFHGLNERNGKLAGLTKISEMEKMAAKMKVRMTTTGDGGWALQSTSRPWIRV